MAILYIRWDLPGLGDVSRRKPVRFSLKLKALAPLVLALILFSLVHLAWKMALLWFGAVLVQLPYDDLTPRVIGRCLLHVFAALLMYLTSDAVCRRLLHSPFYRHRESVGALDAERDQYVILSQGVGSDQSQE
jgi:hypothetical protein